MTTFLGRRCAYLGVNVTADPQGVERPSFQQFVVARSPSLHRVAYLLTADAHHAEDLLQTVLAQVWGRWQRIDRDGGGEAYVRRALFTTYLSWRRRASWHEKPSAQVAIGAPQKDFAPDVDAATDVAQLLRSLPRAQRAVVICRYVEDLTEVQTAQLLSISVGTVKSHTARALAGLRRHPALRAYDRSTTGE